MPKIRYITKRFNSKTLVLIDQCNTIITSYQAQGYDLTVRQLYYRLVASDLIPNRVKEYKRLVRVLSEARLTGMVDWYAITDRTRAVRGNSHWDNGKHLVESAARQFMVDWWETQPFRPEVWIEKDALIGVIGRICKDLDVPYFSCRGYSSLSEVWRAMRRMEYYTNAGQTPFIIHLADHDPSGIDMSRDIVDRLDTFNLFPDFKRLALNMDQVQQYNPPPNPTKMTDSRAPGYVYTFGYDSWELDALDPKVINDLIEAVILDIRDDDKHKETLEREECERERLGRAVDFITDDMEDNPCDEGDDENG